MIDLLAMEEAKPKPAKIRAESNEGNGRPVALTRHAIVSFGPNPTSGQ
jgi:hypothetical protein